LQELEFTLAPRPHRCDTKRRLRCPVPVLYGLPAIGTGPVEDTFGRQGYGEGRPMREPIGLIPTTIITTTAGLTTKVTGIMKITATTTTGAIANLDVQQSGA
jgi:hypothetical protein